MKKQKESIDYAACAQFIYEVVGGRANLKRITHCATRLRLVTVDDTKVSPKRLEQVEGVKGVFFSGGQLQVIIGPGAVNKVFDEFLKISGMDDSGQEEVKRVGREKQPLSVSRVFQAIGEVFVPLLPAIVSAGLISGIMELLAKLSPGFAASDWYAILNLFANTAFRFLPVLIAISAATIFGGNRFMAAEKSNVAECNCWKHCMHACTIFSVFDCRSYHSADWCFIKKNDQLLSDEGIR